MLSYTDPAVILQWLASMGLLTGIQLFVGSKLKAWPDFKNRYIPWVTLLLAILGYQLTPVAAVAAGVAVTAGATPGLVSQVLGTGALVLAQTLLTTGLHSFSKNALLPTLTGLLRAVALTVLKGGSK